MKISVTFRNGEGEDWQKVYAEERIQKLNKYLDSPAEAHIIVSTEKFRNVTEINLSSNGWGLLLTAMSPRAWSSQRGRPHETLQPALFPNTVRWRLMKSESVKPRSGAKD